METLEYGKRAAVKYIRAYADYRAQPHANLTYANQLLNVFINRARHEKMHLPAMPNTGNYLLDRLTFAGAILAIDPAYAEIELFGAALGLSWEPAPAS